MDTPEEMDFGNAKLKERKRIIEADQPAFQAERGPPGEVTSSKFT
jgi:Ino eighty subunit 1